MQAIHAIYVYNPNTGKAKILLIDWFSHVRVAPTYPPQAPPDSASRTPRVALFDPETGAVKNIPNGTPEQSHNLFCNGATTLSSGKVFISGGGHGECDIDRVDEVEYRTSIFDPATETWHKGPDERWPYPNYPVFPDLASNRARRWYPTVVSLADADKAAVFDGLCLGLSNCPFIACDIGCPNAPFCVGTCSDPLGFGSQSGNCWCWPPAVTGLTEWNPREDWIGRAGVPTVFDLKAYWPSGHASPPVQPPFYPPANTWAPLYCAEYGWKRPEWGMVVGVPPGCSAQPANPQNWALRYYPFLFQTGLSGNPLVYAGSTYQNGTDPDNNTLKTRTLSVPLASWTTLQRPGGGDLNLPKAGGSAVIYGRGTGQAEVWGVLVAGGPKPGVNREISKECCPLELTNQVDFLNLSLNMPDWQPKAPMHYRRQWHTLVALADGKILAVGGTQGSRNTSQPVNDTCSPCWAVLEPELYNPANDTWTLMTPMKWPRLYHSLAILDDQGRVFVSGGQADTNGSEYWEVGAPTPPPYECAEGVLANRVRCALEGGNVYLEDGRIGITREQQRTYEIYYPPYFFQGSRPHITQCNDVIQYGKAFHLQTDNNPAMMTKVRLIRPGAVTHGFDQNQRSMELSFSYVLETGDPSMPGPGLRIAAPCNKGWAPPGYYMLFVEGPGMGWPVGPSLPCHKAAWVYLTD